MCRGRSWRCGPTPTSWRRSLEILLANALRYGEAGGSVRVTAEAKGNLVVFAVEDNGRGIPAKDLPHVFERFYRVDSPGLRREAVAASASRW